MDDLENEEYINLHLYKTNYYNEYKILEDMGFNKLMIKKVYAYINPKSIEEAIQFMTTNNNNIYQHEFFPDEDNNKCFYCGEEQKFHINYIKNIKKENIIENKLKDKIKLKDDYFEEEEFDINKNNFDDNIILEAEIGDNVEINEETKEQLSTKGKKATCKILSKNEEGKINESGFFCQILYFNKIIKVLFTNNHILNEDSIKKGNKIEIVYKGDNKIIEINDKRFCKTSPTYDFTCIEILNEDNIEDFYEIENIYNDYKYNDKDIAIVQYPGGGNMEIKTGHLIKIINYNIVQTVSAWYGSSGSPIILLSNYKVIGIHKSYDEEINLNLGTYIKEIIECINKNEILCGLNITKNNLNKEIQIFNYNKTYFSQINSDLSEYFELYLNEEKIKFKWKYKFKKEGKYN